MFTRSGRFYDAIYSFKDYRAESQILLDLLKDKIGGTFLDVACGTGKHVEHLRGQFRCEGLDLDPVLLDIARDRNPGVPFHLGDMTHFDLGKRFDVVACLFSAIGFAATPNKLNAAVSCMAKHLGAGGVLVIEPWLRPEEWQPGKLHMLTVDEPDLKIARMSLPGREGDVSTIHFEYLISTPGHIDHEIEEHRLGLFTDQQYAEAFRRAGLEPELLMPGLMGRGLFVGRKSP